MMEDESAEISGIEFDADNLEEALEIAVDGDDTIQSEYAVVGDVTLVGDSFRDGDCKVAKTEGVKYVNSGGITMADGIGADATWTSVYHVREAIEDAREDEFDAVGYVEDIVASANSVFSAEDDEAISNAGDVVVQHGHMNGSEIRDLEERDAIDIVKIVSNDGGQVGINVRVEEDEAEDEGLGELFG